MALCSSSALEDRLHRNTQDTYIPVPRWHQ